MTSRLVAAFLALVTVVLLLLVVPLGVTNQRSERADLTRRVERDAVAAAAVSVGSLGENPTELPARVTSYLQDYTERSGARVVVVDAEGIELADTTRKKPGERRSFATRPEIKKALSGSVASGTRSSATLGYSLLYVAVPISSGGTPLGAVRVSYPTEELDERIYRYWFAIAAIAFAILGATSLLALILARWVVRPLDKLADAARAMGDGDLSIRVDEHVGPHEVRVLGAALNESVATVERLVNEQSQFVADAAHQLRTPLQALMLRLENLGIALERSDASSDHRDALQADVDRAVGEVSRLSSLVTSLLVLERADEGPSLPPEPVDISEVIRDRQAAWQDLAAQHGATVELDIAEHGWASSLPVHVEQVLDNLVDNAISVSPVGAPVEVVLRASAEHVTVHVIDRGPGMDDAQIEAAFSRFATTRPAAGSRGGFGLGLPIVKRLTELDGGTVTLTRTPRGGLNALVTWPAATLPLARPTIG